jgi:hypothetical protein
MSEFFQRYVDELISDPAFRERHPHFHVRLIPIDELSHVVVDGLQGRDLRDYNKALEALLRGDAVSRVTVDIIEDAELVALSSGDPVLQAARDAGVTELYARLRYFARDVEGAWWTAEDRAGAGTTPTLDLLITEDEEVLISEDGIEFVA